ncbi:LicD family protein [Paenibacillus terrigena]|uniref:LicD family protein n=1 Tax=Paenibacillus terrigena TaxID=369333 RepID=UPI000370264F|nr:LicD family protein [Paenibacillus terrigena]
MDSKEVSIRDVQIRLLEIIDYIDGLCKKNEIQYYLIGGSALGAVRHHGFIPWDDDFDIAMTRENYFKFIKVCEVQLDKEKFYFQKERSGKWPLYFSKIKLNNTVFKEPDAVVGAHHGIFIDVFCFENIADELIPSIWQYICSKLVIAKTLSERGYKSATSRKKMVLSVMKIFPKVLVDKFLLKQIRSNSNETSRVGLLFGRVKYKTAIIPKEYLGSGRFIEFEGRMLPVPEKTHEYLSAYFGDYMKLPPEDKRIGHLPKEIRL